MPSPVGHALAALSVGWMVAPPRSTRRALVVQAAALGAIGVAPDLDLLVGLHRAETHSIGAAVIVASLAAWGRWPVAAERWRIWLAVCFAWLSHPLIDIFSADTSLPAGVMALWPFSTQYFQSDVYLFPAISRRWWVPGFVSQTLTAVTRELLILTPIALGIWWLRARRALRH